MEQLTHHLPSALIHLVGALAFLLATPHLVTRQESAPRRAGAAFYAASVVFLLAMSAAFHWATHRYGDRSGPSEAFRRMDLLAIWVVIAGTMTPVQLACFRGPWRWIPLGLFWVASAAGVLVKVFWFGSFSLPANFAMYVAVGLLALGCVARAIAVHGLAFVRLLLAGWVAVAVGAVFFALRPPDLIPEVIGQHELWHTFILVGMACTWTWVLRTASFDPGADAGEPA
ncbi:MAG: hemolysin III family protein [Planctomycetota bacterium]